MANVKKIALYAGIIGAVASVGSLVMPENAVSQSTTGGNSPAISGNGNSVTYSNGFPSQEAIQAGRPDISEQQYAAIKPGMSYQEVMGIVKIPGKEAATNGSVQIYTWGNESYVYMTMTFMDGKLQSKSH